MTQEPNRPNDWMNQTIGFFSSVKLTLVIIAALVVLSFAGIAGWLQVYLAERHIDRIYHWWPFNLLLGLLFINLLICTLDRLPGTLRRIRMDGGPTAPPAPREPDHLVATAIADPREALARAEGLLFGPGPHLRREQERKAKGEAAAGTDHVSFHSTGRWSLLGVQVTHLGILLIILGGIVGGMRSMRGQIHLSPGEQSDKLFVTYADQTTETPLPFTVRCNDFKITYYSDRQMPSDYLCDLSILVDGKEVRRQTIQVNSPLHYTPAGEFADYGIYQAQYFPMFRLTLTSIKDGSTTGADLRQYDPYDVPGTDLSYLITEYRPNMKGMGRDLGPAAQVEIYRDERFVESVMLFSSAPAFDKGREYDPNRLSFRPLPGRWATGLEVIKDPGVPLIWAGAFFLCFGASLALFLMHRRYWLVARATPEGAEVALIGRSARGQNLFQDRLKAMAEKLEAGIKTQP